MNRVATGWLHLYTVYYFYYYGPTRIKDYNNFRVVVYGGGKDFWWDDFF